MLVVWLLIFPWSGEGDAVTHYLHARAALANPAYAMSAFDRPVHKLLLFLPAQGGLICARIWMALVSTICIWQTVRLAEDLGLRNSLLAAPLLLFQPYTFALASDTMTELPMALLIVIAIRLWLHNRLVLSCVVMSFSPAARPEGAFLIPLWGILMLLRRDFGTFTRRLLRSTTLAIGMLCWWLLGIIFTRDPLFLIHAWFWPANSAETAGHGELLHYVHNWREYCGPILIYPFYIGFACAVLATVFPFVASSRRRFASAPSCLPSVALPIAVWLIVFTLHSFLWWRGMFGSLGLLRWIVPTAPLTAIFCLCGLNLIADLLRLVRIAAPIRATLAILTIALAATNAILFSASGPYRYHGFAIRRCVAYILDNHLLESAPALLLGDAIAYAELPGPQKLDTASNAWDRKSQLAIVRRMPPGSIALWDDQQAQMWHCITIEDLQSQGFRILYDDRSLAPSFPCQFDFRPLRYWPLRYAVLRKDRQVP